MLFMSLSNLGAINLQSVLIVAGAERNVLYRERAAGLYSALMYVNSTALVSLACSFGEADPGRFARSEV